MYDLTHPQATIVNIANGQNYVNVLGAEAVMPYISPSGDDEVFLAYSTTANNFYPGTQYVSFDIPQNSIFYSASFEGNVVPPACDPHDPYCCAPNRLFDFMNGVEPIYNKKEVFFNGFLALSASPDSQPLCNDLASVSVVVDH